MEQRREPSKMTERINVVFSTRLLFLLGFLLARSRALMFSPAASSMPMGWSRGLSYPMGRGFYGESVPHPERKRPLSGPASDWKTRREGKKGTTSFRETNRLGLAGMCPVLGPLGFFVCFCFF